jgi:maltose operon protein
MAVASCATMVSHERAVNSLRSARVCCESVAQFGYEDLGESGGVSFKLDEASDAFDFQTGKSYFKAFRLPQRELPYRISVRSLALGEHIKEAHIFYPQVAVLDDRFAVVGQSDPGDFSLGKAGVGEAAAETWGLPVKLEGSVLVDNASAKYVVVFTTQEMMSGASPYEARWVVPVIVPGVVTAIPGGKETVSIRHSPVGLLHMEIVHNGARHSAPHPRG